MTSDGHRAATERRRLGPALALVTCTAAAMLGGATRPAWANAGAPSFGGVPVGEASGLAGIHIVSETLSIDLRPVGGGDVVTGETEGMGEGGRRNIVLGTAAAVTATYRLANPGPARTVELRFAHGAERVRDFRVDVDGRAVAGERVDEAVPDTWRPPRFTPGPGGPEHFAYNDDRGGDTVAPHPWAFRAPLPAGASRLTVAYRAEAGTYLAEPLIVRQFAYILAPARDWAGFGPLDVAVDVPRGWLAWSAPPLERQGDRLVGRFDGVPADALALSVQPPVGTARRLALAGTNGLLLAAFLGGAFAVWLAGGRRRRAGGFRDAAGSLAMGALWAGAVFAAGFARLRLPAAVTPRAHLTFYGYGSVVGLVLLALQLPLTTLLGLVLGWPRRRMPPSAADAPTADDGETSIAPHP